MLKVIAAEGCRPVIVMMRYSILQESRGGWRIRRRQSFEGYRAELFDDVRLSQRLTTLKRVVIPSLVSQTIQPGADHFRLAIFTSDELPPHHLQNLAETIAPWPWIQLIMVRRQDRPNYEGEARRFLCDIGYRGPFATVRLDDDDALARVYLERLVPLIAPGSIGHAITFSQGYAAYLDPTSGTCSTFYSVVARFTALGLAAVASFDGSTISPAERPTIYHYGKHSSIGRNFPFIEDSSFPAFLRTVYAEQDTRGGARSKLSWWQRAAPAEVLAHVNVPTKADEHRVSLLVRVATAIRRRRASEPAKGP